MDKDDAVKEVEQAAKDLEGASSPVAVDVVEAWFARTFQDSVVSRNTEIYNFVRAAVNDLKTELAG
jgi:hypothetical protein